jgi:antitoxin HicB
MMLQFRVVLEPDDNNTLLVTSPDLPGMVTFGNSRADALHRAVGAIEEWLAATIHDKEKIPLPRIPARLKANEGIVRLPTMTALKVQLYTTMRQEGVTVAELARRLGWHRNSADRLFDLNHASKLSQIEAAAEALGKTVDVAIEAAA